MTHSILSRMSLVAALLIVLPLSSALGQLPQTNLFGIYPPGGKQGTSFDVTITGNDLDDVNSLIFLNPGITATQKTSEATSVMPAQPITNQFTLTIDGSVPPGIYEARIVGRFGTSNPRGFEVGRFDDIQDDGSNKSLETAKEIAIPQTANGRVDASNRDYWKVTLKKGQRVIIDCSAERIDSRLDGTLAIYNAQGRELLRNRDAIGADPMIDFSAPSDGQYTIGLYDFVYRGGADYYYRLSVHSAPFIDFVFPPAGPVGSNSQYTIYGRNLPGGKPVANLTVDGDVIESLTVNINIPTDEDAKQRRGSGTIVPLHCAMLDGMDYQLDSPSGPSNPVTMGYTQAPPAVEAEPNDSADKAQRITIPCDLAGQFYPARDIDWVEFEAKQGDVYWVEVISHRMGLPTDPNFLIQRITKNDKGEESVSDINSTDDPGDRNTRFGQDYDTSTDDPRFRFQVPSDGTYRIAVRDQFNSSSPDPRRVYRLVVRNEQPDFQLVCSPTPDGPVNNNIVLLLSNVVRKGGTLAINVNAELRDNFVGQIEVSVEGLPAGVTCHGATISNEVTTGTLVIAAADNAAAWAGSIKIIGKANVNGKEIVRVAKGGCPIWGTTNRQNDPPQFRMVRNISLSVVDAETSIAFVDIEDKIWETSRGGKLEVPIKVTRTGEFKDDMKLTPFGNPKDIKPADITVKGNATDGKIAVEVTSAAAKAGFYTFCFKSDVKFKYPRNADAIKQAEEEQKRLDQLVKDLTPKQKEANDTKTKATQEATAAVAALKAAQAARDAANQALQKAAEDQKTAAQTKLTEAETALTDAQSKATTADQAKAASEKASTDADQNLKAAQDAKKQADTNVTNAKNANKVADKTITVYSQPIKLHVVDSPTDLTVTSPGGPLKQGEKVEIPVKVDRKYGFDDQVQILFEPPKGVAGLSIAALNIAKGQGDGKIEVTAAKNATPGEHTVTIRARSKFNNVNNLDTTQDIVVKVEEVKEEKK